jgi:hypothetical protein
VRFFFPHRLTHDLRLTDAAIVDAELSRLRIIDNQREKVHKQKLKGLSSVICYVNNNPLLITYKQDFSTKLRRRQRQWSHRLQAHPHPTQHKFIDAFRAALSFCFLDQLSPQYPMTSRNLIFLYNQGFYIKVCFAQYIYIKMAYIFS